MKKLFVAISILSIISCVELQTNYKPSSSASSGGSSVSNPTYSKNQSSIVNPVKFRRNKWICFDKNLKQKFTIDAYDVSPFSNGLAAVKSYPSGYVDTNGNYFPVKARILMDFHSSATWVQLLDRDGYSLINRKGEILSNTTYLKVKNFDKGANVAEVYNSKKELALINVKGKIVAPFGKYSKIGTFNEGMAFVVNKNGKHGAIDINGKETVPCVFDRVANFSEGLSMATKGNRYGYIDKNGKTIIPFKFLPGSSSFHNGYARIHYKKGNYKKGEGMGLINKKGEIVYKTKKDT